jgi:PKD repeat protein
MTNWTVGGVGADYANWKAVADWLITNSPLADDHTFTQTGNTVDNVDCQDVAFNPNGNTVTFTCALADSHSGDPTSGYSSTIGGGVTIVFRCDAATSGTVICENLRIVRPAVPATIMLLMSNSSAAVDGAFTFITRNVLFKGAQTASDELALFTGGATQDTIRVYNCKAWNCWRMLGNIVASGGVVFGTKTFENLTAYSCGTGITASFGGNAGILATYRNCVCVDCNTDWAGSVVPDWKTSGLYRFYNCADSDNTLAAVDDAYRDNCQFGITSADEFQSLDDTNSKFLFLKDGTFDADFSGTPLTGPAPLSVAFTDLSAYNYGDGVLGDGGTAPTYAGATDIASEPRPNDGGDYAIGCHEVAQFS